ncbi:hypothetical protein TSA66_00325 [Noviherbaspirillum autotrophicum]|uniref:Uncharacterized protein n=1 Tax=Noviherbaspirillum autotrophicum TaxID=709839 RepID=A0A0C2C1I3_9BURK|nr:hypothetical protein TSA66_21055 [Noviherbaspirillum autotrophicum]KIF84201.1 hypothetical protein TSA66_00325 [Noviherbaspirillum autotrophicum]
MGTWCGWEHIDTLAFFGKATPCQEILRLIACGACRHPAIQIIGVLLKMFIEPLAKLVPNEVGILEVEAPHPAVDGAGEVHHLLF